MAQMTVRPSTVFVKLTYGAALVVAGAIAWVGLSAQPASNAWLAAFVLPVAIVLFGVKKHLRIRFTVIEIVGDRLKYEAGILSKTARSIPLSKVQDVGVNQTLTQRLLGIGRLSIETAGESSRLIMEDVPSPRQIADQILDRVASAHPDKKSS